MSNFQYKAMLLGVIALVSYPAEATDKLTLRIELEKQIVSLVLVNDGMKAASASEGYALSGLAGGNVVPLVVTTYGQLMPPCGYMDSFVKIKRPVPINPGQRVVVWKGTAEIIAGLHCLEAGRYTLAFSYVAPDGRLVFTTSSVAIVVGEKFSAEIHPIVQVE